MDIIIIYVTSVLLSAAGLYSCDMFNKKNPAIRTYSQIVIFFCGINVVVTLFIILLKINSIQEK